MSSIHKLETRIAGWYSNAPHLPKNGQKWLAENVWWIAVIGAVFGAFALLAIVPLTLVALGLSATANLAPSTYGYETPAVMWTSVLISAVSLVIITVLTAMAILPLKDRRKKGWDLIFISMLVNAASLVLSVITADFSGLIGGVIGLALGGYFLFEIRNLFLASKAKADGHKSAKAEAK